MTNIVMTVYNRHRLTEQALVSLTAHTNCNDYTLTIVDDGSTDFRLVHLLHKYWLKPNVTAISIDKSAHIISRARNIGAWWASQTFGPAKYICFLDNDVCLFNGWLKKLIEQCDAEAAIIGGCQHPYHKSNVECMDFHETDMVAGYCMLMSFSDWCQYGPFTNGAAGVGQSEDTAICRKVVESGRKVGYVHPPVLAHCGITNTDGKPAIGADQFPRVRGILYE